MDKEVVILVMFVFLNVIWFYVFWYLMKCVFEGVVVGDIFDVIDIFLFNLLFYLMQLVEVNFV